MNGFSLFNFFTFWPVFPVSPETGLVYSLYLSGGLGYAAVTD